MCIAEVLLNGQPYQQWSGPDAEDKAWEFVMRKELLGDPRADLFDVHVVEMEEPS